MADFEVKEFVIPLDKDELLQSRAGKFSVENVIPPGALVPALDATRGALQDNGAKFILNHFDTFFSVLVHGHRVHFPVTMRAFDRILKATNGLISEMELLFEDGSDISVEEKPLYLCINKMYAYLLSSLSCYIEDYICKNSASKDASGKRKKNAPKKTDAEEEWEVGKQKVLETMYRWLQLPLQKLWTPPIVEDLFLTALTQFCYKVLEQNRDAKQKQCRETIFEILGTLVKRYNHGITCVVRIIQLVKLYDALAAPMAAGVVHMISTTGCIGFIKEIMKEIDQTEPSETEARHISTFLEAVASLKPDLILPLLDNVTEHLGSECYSMRNCVVGVLGAVVIGALTGDQLSEENREKRDQCLSNLEQHLLDINAYVRSKCFQIWQRLSCQGAVPLQRQCSLLKATCDHLVDKSPNVRKQALQLLRAMLQGNPFAAKLDQARFSRELEEAQTKLKDLRAGVASASTRGDSERLELWESLLPEIRKAITKIVSDESDEDDSSDDEADKSQRELEIDRDTAFEKVRQLLLAEDAQGAVAYLKKICSSIEGAPDMSNMTEEARENCYFMFLLKIFIDSENSEDQPEGANNAETSEDLKKRKEEVKAQRRLVNYLKNCVDFAKQLEKSMPTLEILVFSTTTGDVVEACAFLSTACQFRVPKALGVVQKALSQVLNRDQSVKTSVANLYKEIYLSNTDGNQSSRQKALSSVNGLIELFKGLEPGRSPALCQLIAEWRASGEFGPEELQVMWEKFSMKIPDTQPIESRAALALLTMVASNEPTLITDNLDVLIKIGLEPRPIDDLLLARDTCRALMKIRHKSNNPEKSPLKYRNDHAIFREILDLAVNHFSNTKDDGYVSFVTDVINVTYHLANQPDVLMKSLLLDIVEKNNLLIEPRRGNSTVSSQEVSSDANNTTMYLLSRLLYIVGHVAIKEMVHLDNGIYKELKRRNVVREMKKGAKKANTTNRGGEPGATPLNNTRSRLSTPASARQTLRNKEANNTTHEDNGEEALEGATADDTDAQFVDAALENDIVNGIGVLAKFVPLITDVCTYPEKYNDEQLQAWGVLALSKMMTVSSAFCSKSLQLLVTIMERSTYPGVRANVLVGFCDLTIRFPNEVEPWTSHIYGRLRDPDVKVRTTCVRMLSNLIMREMIRVKGQVSALALSIIDPEEPIRAATKQFFKELSNKGNALYNIMPDIISKLTDSESNLEEDDFREIIKYILGLMQKERQIDTIIDKLCSRFVLATTERQWRDLSYCLSLLQFSAKSIRRLMESLPLLKDKIHHKLVQKSLQTIIEQTKKKAQVQAACVELEEKIKDLLKTTEEPNEAELEDRAAMPPPRITKVQKQARRSKSRRNASSSDEENDIDDEISDNSDEENIPANNAKRNPTPRKGKGRTNVPVTDSSSDSDEDEETRKSTKTPSKTPKNSGKRKKTTETPSTETPGKSKTKRNRQYESPIAGTSSQPTPRRTSTRNASKRQ